MWDPRRLLIDWSQLATTWLGRCGEGLTSLSGRSVVISTDGVKRESINYAQYSSAELKSGSPTGKLQYTRCAGLASKTVSVVSNAFLKPDCDRCQMYNNIHEMKVGVYSSHTNDSWSVYS